MGGGRFDLFEAILSSWTAIANLLALLGALLRWPFRKPVDGAERDTPILRHAEGTEVDSHLKSSAETPEGEIEAVVVEEDEHTRFRLGERDFAALDIEVAKEATPRVRIRRERLKRPKEIKLDSHRLERLPPQASARVDVEGHTSSFQLIDIFFGTDRRPDRRVAGGFGPRRAGNLSLGKATVSVPRVRRKGSIPRPAELLNILLSPERADRHFILRGVTLFDGPKDFISAAAPDVEKPSLLFVHGFATDFRAGLFSTAMLATDLEVEGRVFHYAWPSLGRKGLHAYDVDADNVRQARAHFVEFLQRVAEAGVSKLNIVAHSKGNDLVLEVLRSLPRRAQVRNLRQLVMASPDMDCAAAAQMIPEVRKRVRGVTLYACRDDLALAVSEMKTGGPPRAGDLLEDGAPLIVKGMDSVDATGGRLHLMAFNHNTYVADPVVRNDLRVLLRSGKRPPHTRSPSLIRRPCARGTYWKLESR